MPASPSQEAAKKFEGIVLRETDDGTNLSNDPYETVKMAVEWDMGTKGIHTINRYDLESLLARHEGTDLHLLISKTYISLVR